MLRCTPTLLALAALCGCTTDAINVSEGVLAEQVNYHWLTSSREGEKAVFSPLDEKAVLSVRFDYNYRGSYEWYKVEWISPSGEAYKVVSTRTEFGSHRDLKAELPIRGKMAAALPGLWRVRLSHLGRDGEPDRLLISRLFRIEPMSEEMLASVEIDPPVADERPLAGDLPADSRPLSASPLPAAPEPDAVTADSTGPQPDAPVPALSPVTAGSTDAPRIEQRIEPVRVASAGTGSGEPAGPGEGVGRESPAGTGELPPETEVEPLSRSGLLIAELIAVSGSPGSRTRSPSAARPTARPSALAREWPGCPPLYYPPGPGCVEQAPQE